MIIELAMLVRIMVIILAMLVRLMIIELAMLVRLIIIIVLAMIVRRFCLFARSPCTSQAICFLIRAFALQSDALHAFSCFTSLCATNNTANAVYSPSTAHRSKAQSPSSSSWTL